MKWLFLAFFLMVANTSFAFDLPSFYKVTGVASNDVLNVRKNPTSKAAILGELQYDATNVEVVMLSQDSKWARVNVGDTAGWTSMRFLERQSQTERPVRLICFGNEPFWTMSLDENALFKLMDHDETFLGALEEISSVNRTDRKALRSKSVTSALTAHLAARSCNDTMSERAYGLSIDALISSDNGTAYYSGCCRLNP